MSERKEKSASQIQIEERQERLKTMMDLAEGKTYLLIRETIEKNPKASEDSIFNVVKNLSISEFEFVATYILDFVTVSQKTATEYFDTFIRAKKFVSMEHRNFRLNDTILKLLIKEEKGKVNGQ